MTYWLTTLLVRHIRYYLQDTLLLARHIVHNEREGLAVVGGHITSQMTYNTDNITCKTHYLRYYLQETLLTVLHARRMTTCKTHYLQWAQGTCSSRRIHYFINDLLHWQPYLQVTLYTILLARHFTYNEREGLGVVGGHITLWWSEHWNAPRPRAFIYKKRNMCSTMVLFNIYMQIVSTKTHIYIYMSIYMNVCICMYRCIYM